MQRKLHWTYSVIYDFIRLLEQKRDKIQNLFSVITTSASSDPTTDGTTEKIDFEQQPESQPKQDSSSEELNIICAKLCSLMKAQLVKSHDEVMSR